MAGKYVDSKEACLTCTAIDCVGCFYILTGQDEPVKLGEANE